METIKEYVVAEKFNTYENRLASFRNQNVLLVDVKLLSRAGFYFGGVVGVDIVSCPYCRLSLFCWKADDDPKLLHKKYKPFCEFVERNFEDFPPKVPKVAKVETDSTQVYRFPNSVPEDEVLPSKFHKYGMSRFTKRLQSFKYWPKALSQIPEELALAGFYYMGRSDIVHCYCCGICIYAWEPLDDPWIEHAKYTPTLCQHLLHERGLVFLKEHNQQLNLNEKPNEKAPTDIVEANTEAPVQVLLAKISHPSSSASLSCICCVEANRSVVFLPCRHILMCKNCSCKVVTCPNCRMQIDQKLDVYY